MLITELIGGHRIRSYHLSEHPGRGLAISHGENRGVEKSDLLERAASILRDDGPMGIYVLGKKLDLTTGKTTELLLFLTMNPRIAEDDHGKLLYLEEEV